MTVCAALIVKDEAHVIERCIAAVRPYVDAVAIVDTGSTDDTVERASRALDGAAYLLTRRTWAGFGDARTAAFGLATKTGCGYAFVLDADEVFTPPGGFTWPTDGRDVYSVEMNVASIVWPQPRLFRLACGWRYEGVLHEIAVSETSATSGTLPGVQLASPRDGARSKNPDKYQHDAIALEQALETDPGNARYAFYCGQSWRDAGNDDKAVHWYERRASMGPGSNRDEIYVSLYETARALHRRWKGEHKDIRAAYLRAHRADPSRAEALCELARLCRETGEPEMAWHFASLASRLPQPVGLFVDRSAHTWRAKDEMALAALGLGKPSLAATLTKDALSALWMADADRLRLVRNLYWFQSAASAA